MGDGGELHVRCGGPPVPRIFGYDENERWSIEEKLVGTVFPMVSIRLLEYADIRGALLFQLFNHLRELIPETFLELGELVLHDDDFRALPVSGGWGVARGLNHVLDDGAIELLFAV